MGDHAETSMSAQSKGKNVDRGRAASYPRIYLDQEFDIPTRLTNSDAPQTSTKGSEVPQIRGSTSTSIKEQNSFESARYNVEHEVISSSKEEFPVEEEGNVVIETRSLLTNLTEGLQCVYNGSGLLNIIFVHGLDGDPYYSWSDTRIRYWPKDFLQMDIPTANVWTFGWSGSLRHDTPLHEIANNIVSAVSLDICNCQSKPRFAFIASGLGGTIVKQVMLDCSQGEPSRKRYIWSRCESITFLAVPHNLVQKDLYTSSGAFGCIEKFGANSKGNDYTHLLNSLEDINLEYMTVLAKMPNSFCVVRISSDRGLFGEWREKLNPDRVNSTLKSRQGSDFNYNYTSSCGPWVIEERKNELYKIIVDQIKSHEYAFPKVISSSLPTGARLLSIDGGGVRGYCSLMILKAIMREVSKLDRSRRTEHPDQYFDLAGGTSTGGLIAIMLFRLHMDATRALDRYATMSPKIFKRDFFTPIGSKAVKGFFGKSQYKADALEEAIKEIIIECLPDSEKEIPGIEVSEATLLPPRLDPLTNPEDEEHYSKMFVCALKTGGSSQDRIVRLRSYPSTEKEFDHCKIWQAARATSAAPFFFPTAHIGNDKFWDGGLEHNNPITQVWEEYKRLTPNGDDKNSCVVSLGTGYSTREFQKSWIPAVSKGRRILKNLTKTEPKHQEFERKAKEEGIPYFRFNPPTGDDEIGLADFGKIKLLERYTKDYLALPETQQKIKECAARLVRTDVSAIKNVASGSEQLLDGASQSLNRAARPHRHARFEVSRDLPGSEWNVPKAVKVKLNTSEQTHLIGSDVLDNSIMKIGPDEVLEISSGDEKISMSLSSKEGIYITKHRSWHGNGKQNQEKDATSAVANRKVSEEQ